MLGEKVLDFNGVKGSVIPNKQVVRNKNANGVNKYLKKYLHIYDWRERQKLIVNYTSDKIHPQTKLPINKMKSRYLYIQENFDNFVSYLRSKIRK